MLLGSYTDILENALGRIRADFHEELDAEEILGFADYFQIPISWAFRRALTKGDYVHLIRFWPNGKMGVTDPIHEWEHADDWKGFAFLPPRLETEGTKIMAELLKHFKEV